MLVNTAGGNTDLSAPRPGESLSGIASAWRVNLEASLTSAALTTAADYLRSHRAAVSSMPSPSMRSTQAPRTEPP